MSEKCQIYGFHVGGLACQKPSRAVMAYHVVFGRMGDPIDFFEGPPRFVISVVRHAGMEKMNRTADEQSFLF